MPILRWDKPKQVMSQDEWSSIAADSAPPGVYTPNMSQEDQLAWKAKFVRRVGDLSSVEIRKRAKSLMLIRVFKNFILISANGTIELTDADFTDLCLAVAEAREKLNGTH